MLESGSCNDCKNAAVPIIVMLDCLKIDMKVLDTDMKTADSDDCRKMSKDNRNANDVLAVMQERARFSCKDRWKFINLFTQPISRLCQISQLYPRTKEQKKLNKMI